MRAIPIADTDIPEGCRRKVLTGPSGDPNDPEIGAMDVIIGHVHTSLGVSLVFHSKWKLEPGDLDRLAGGGALWLSCFGAQVPVMLVAGETP